MTDARKTVLLADDESRWRGIGEDLLKDAYHVETLKVRLSGEVVERVKRGGVDLLVVDFLMPGEEPIETGFDVCVYLHKHYPDLPLILWTGALEDSTMTREELEKQTGARVVFKAIHDPQLDDLAARVREFLG
jgi:CheY-like chemotaxis protein